MYLNGTFRRYEALYNVLNVTQIRIGPRRHELGASVPQFNLKKLYGKTVTVY